MIYKLEDIAIEIKQDLSLDTANGAIVYWLKNNIGTLNNLIYTSYAINDGDGQISSDISIEAISILKKLYELYNYDSLIRSNLGASAFTAVTEVSENGNRVRLVNRTEMGRVYADLKKQTFNELTNLINGYLQKQGGSAVVSVDGVDGSLPNETFYTTYGYKRGSNNIY